MKSTGLVLTIFILSAIGLQKVAVSEPLLIDVNANDLANGGPVTQPAPTVSTSSAKTTVTPVANSANNASDVRPGPAATGTNTGGADQAAGRLNGIFDNAGQSRDSLVVTPSGPQPSTATTTMGANPLIAGIPVPPRPRHQTPTPPAVTAPEVAIAATATPAQSTTTVAGSTVKKDDSKTAEKSTFRLGALVSYGLPVTAGALAGAFLLHSFLWTLSLGFSGYLVGGYIYDALKDTKGGMNWFALGAAVIAGGLSVALGFSAGFSLLEKIVLGLAGAAGGFVIGNEATKPEEPAQGEKPTTT